jgi:hypothetical protein
MADSIAIRILRVAVVGPALLTTNVPPHQPPGIAQEE